MYASSQLEKLEDMFSRISAEGQIHSNLQSVISKLHNEGTLDRLHSEFKAIFENEVKYTLNSEYSLISFAVFEEQAEHWHGRLRPARTAVQQHLHFQGELQHHLKNHR